MGWDVNRHERGSHVVYVAQSWAPSLGWIDYAGLEWSHDPAITEARINAVRESIKRDTGVDQAFIMVKRVITNETIKNFTTLVQLP